MADEFFKDQEETQEVEKIKLGDREFSQDELNKLVGLGEKAVELETKWNTKIDRLYPEFTKKTQRLAEIEPEFEKLKTAQEQKPVVVNPGDLTPEQKDEIRKNLMDILGGKPLTDKEFDNYYVERRNAEKLLEDSQAVVDEAKTLGKPQTSVEDLLQHMNETGIKNPGKAYKDMFETELDQWKEAQLKKAKPSTFTTQTQSTAGSKQPAPVRPNRNNLGEMLSSALGDVV